MRVMPLFWLFHVLCDEQWAHDNKINESQKYRGRAHETLTYDITGRCVNPLGDRDRDELFIYIIYLKLQETV